MSFQWATRAGVVRHLRLGNALARPTRVISMQNQLRRVCLPTKSQLTRPHVSSLSAFVCQQSHSFATTTESPKAKRGRKPASGKRKKSSAKPKPKKKKKVLTEDQKARKEQRERREKIKALKATALEPPKKLATSAWPLAFASKFHEVRTESQSPNDTLKEVAAVIKAMSPDEYEVCPCESSLASIGMKSPILTVGARPTKSRLRRIRLRMRLRSSRGLNLTQSLKSRKRTKPESSFPVFRKRRSAQSRTSDS